VYLHVKEFLVVYIHVTGKTPTKEDRIMQRTQEKNIWAAVALGASIAAVVLSTGAPASLAIPQPREPVQSITIAQGDATDVRVAGVYQSPVWADGLEAAQQ
jgi:hypothetical protein